MLLAKHFAMWNSLNSAMNIRLVSFIDVVYYFRSVVVTLFRSRDCLRHLNTCFYSSTRSTRLCLADIVILLIEQFKYI